MITIIPRKLSGNIKIIASKSLSHRYLIASALSCDKSIIKNLQDSNDITATTNALRLMGAHIKGSKIRGTYLIHASNEINCYDSASTLRFLIPLAMLNNKETKFVGSASLAKRPLDVYRESFSSFDYIFSHPINSFLPLVVKGPLRPGNYYLRADVSSQFISGLLFALPLLKGDSKIILTSSVESRSYIDLTVDVLRKHKIDIQNINNEFIIRGNQKYKGIKVKVEGDYSQAAFFLVAGTIGDKISIKNLNNESLQGDKKIINIINRMGGKAYFNKNTLIAEPKQTRGSNIDLNDIPDLGPVLMVLASLSKGKTTFTNINRLRIKESNRIESMYEELTKLGVNISVSDNKVEIIGQDYFEGDVNLSVHNDHRIAMSLAVASIKCRKPITLNDAAVVNKSYPNFFNEFVKLGGKIL